MTLKYWIIHCIHDDRPWPCLILLKTRESASQHSLHRPEFCAEVWLRAEFLLNVPQKKLELVMHQVEDVGRYRVLMFGTGIFSERQFVFEDACLSLSDSFGFIKRAVQDGHLLCCCLFLVSWELSGSFWNANFRICCFAICLIQCCVWGQSKDFEMIRHGEGALRCLLVDQILDQTMFGAEIGFSEMHANLYILNLLSWCLTLI